MSGEDIPEEFKKNEWLHVCSISLANEPEAEAVPLKPSGMKTAGGYISFDPNLRDEVANPSGYSLVMKAVELADVVKFSEEELDFLTDSNSMEQGASSYCRS